MVMKLIDSIQWPLNDLIVFIDAPADRVLYKLSNRPGRMNAYIAEESVFSAMEVEIVLSQAVKLVGTTDTL